jgi:DNA polymerase I
MKPARLLILDISNYMHRAHHGLPPMNRKSDGMLTSALHGTISMVLADIEYHKPTHVLACMDSPSWRLSLHPGYKAGRYVNVDLVIQFRFIQRLLEALGVEVAKFDRFEADDLMVANARRFQETHGRSCHVIISTTDKDMCQAVNKQVWCYNGIRKSFFTPTTVKERFGVTPKQFADLLSLMGDAGDCVPGVSGIGPVTAAKLLQTYGTIQEVYRNLDALPKGQQGKLRAGKGHAILSRKLVKLNGMTPIGPVPVFDTKPYTGPESDCVKQLLRYDLHALAKQIK